MRRSLLLILVLLLSTPVTLVAQLEETTPGGLRAYWHVFISYVLVWLFIGGWLVMIARKLGRVGRDLEG
jgi:hypothetical protein